MWEVEFTDEFGTWWDALTEQEQRSVRVAVEELRAAGPGLGRPFVDTIKGSRYPNMKELRPRQGNLRVLFAFDPRRTAILLLGGNKTGRWREWYEDMIPVADRLYGIYIEELHQEGELP